MAPKKPVKKAAKAAAGKAKAKAEDSVATAEPSHPEDAKAALSAVQQAVDYLKKKKLWQSLKPTKMSQVRPWPEGFTGAMVEKVATFSGTVADVNFDNLELASEVQLRESAFYWFGEDREQPQALFVSAAVHSETQRGDLTLTEDHAKLAGLVLLWSESERASDEKRSAALRKICSSIVFGVSRVQASDITSHKAVLNTIQQGEDAYKTASEAANSLQMALFKENPEQAKQRDVFNALQTIQWSSEEAKVENEDKVEKLLTLHKKSVAAGLHVALQSTQIVRGVRTWLSKWGVVTRVATALKTTEEFRFVMCFYVKAGMFVAPYYALLLLTRYLQELRPDALPEGATAARISFHSGYPDLRKLTRDQILQATSALHMRFVTVEKLCDLKNPSDRSDVANFLSLLKQALDPFKWATADWAAFSAFASEPFVTVASFVMKIMAGEMDKTFQEAAGSAEKEQYPDLMAAIREVSDKWSMAMNPAPSPPPEPQAERARSFQCQMEEEVDTPSKLSPEQLRERQLAAAVEAGNGEEECAFYVHYVVSDVRSASATSLVRALSDHRLLSGDNVTGVTLWYFDPSLVCENHPYARVSSNMYTRTPVFDKCALSTFLESYDRVAREEDVYLTLDAGVQKGSQEIKKGVLSAVPLPNPADLVHGTWAEKKTAIPEKLGKMVLTSEGADGEKMPLFFFEKSEAFYNMVLHATFNPDRVVLMTPGEGTFVTEAVRQRTSVICIVANEQQKDILMANIKKRLRVRVANANDRRFYRPPMTMSVTPSAASSEAPSLRPSTPAAPGEAPATTTPTTTTAVPKASATTAAVPEAKAKAKSTVESDDDGDSLSGSLSQEES
ncbi:unnamed protein product [Symbiodinium sp. CCMP2592]|nr:unnamed protein product [Symbiodinium sp. CCMP2592]